MTDVFTDGSYSAKTGHGGWAWVTPEGKHNTGFCANGGSSFAMEVRAVLEALRNLKDPLVIHCDNVGVVKILSWHPSQRSSWLRGMRRKEDLALELFLLTHEALLLRDVTFEHVKGHVGHPYHTEADRLARKSRKQPLTA